MVACGLDFGTSNTTLGARIGGQAQLLPLEAEHTTIPSAIFFDFADTQAKIGRAAIAAYVGGTEGRLMRSLKSVLGTDLIDQDTLLQRNRIGFRDVLARLLGEIKHRAELVYGNELTKVVHGRPVHFVDGNDEADRRAEAALADIARSVGFREVSFQYEPIAAALDTSARSRKKKSRSLPISAVAPRISRSSVWDRARGAMQTEGAISWPMTVPESAVPISMLPCRCKASWGCSAIAPPCGVQNC